MRGRCAPGLVILLLACTEPADAPPRATTVVDTTGGVVQIRHNGARPPARLQPLVAIGTTGSGTGEPSPEEFGRVESVIADGEGRIFVADGMALEIRVFDADGRFLRRLGGEGSGPGEMRGLHGITWLSGDTMLVMDFGNARLTHLTSTGEQVGQWRWMRMTGSQRFLFNGGPRELYAYAFRTSSDGEMEPVWARFTPDGAQDSLAIPGDPWRGAVVTCYAQNGIGFFTNPYRERLLAVPAPGSQRVVARSAAYRIAFIDASGDTTALLSRDVAPLPLPDSMWAPVAADYDRFERSWRGTRCEGELRRPPNRPVLRDLYFGHEGRLLVEYATPTGLAFDLFERYGTWLATFAAPPDRDRSVPPFLRGDRLYLVTEDSLGLQTVRGYRIAPQGGRPLILETAGSGAH